MKRVVVTGMGIVSSIGNNADEVLTSLKEAKSGISISPEFVDYGFRSQVYGAPTLDPFEVLERRTARFMSKGTAWNYIAMQQAIDDARLEEDDIVNPRTGIIMGSGGPSTKTIVEAAQKTLDTWFTQTHWPDRRAKSDEFHCLCGAFYPVQDQRRKLFNFIRMRHIKPLHRQCL